MEAEQEHDAEDHPQLEPHIIWHGMLPPGPHDVQVNVIREMVEIEPFGFLICCLSLFGLLHEGWCSNFHVSEYAAVIVAICITQTVLFRLLLMQYGIFGIVYPLQYSTNGTTVSINYMQRINLPVFALWITYIYEFAMLKMAGLSLIFFLAAYLWEVSKLKPYLDSCYAFGPLKIWIRLQQFNVVFFAFMLGAMCDAWPESVAKSPTANAFCAALPGPARQFLRKLYWL